MSAPLLMPQDTVYFAVGMQLYITDTIKFPTLKAISVLFDGKSTKFQKARAVKMLWDAFQATKGLPEPTKENTWHPNTHNLIDLRDWLFDYCHLDKLRLNLIRRVINFVIIIYDFDPPWRFIFDSLREEALKKEWKPTGWNDTWVESYRAWWHERYAWNQDWRPGKPTQ